VLCLLGRAAKAGLKTLQAAYKFLAEEWRDGRLTASTEGGIHEYHIRRKKV